MLEKQKKRLARFSDKNFSKFPIRTKNSQRRNNVVDENSTKTFLRTNMETHEKKGEDVEWQKMANILRELESVRRRGTCRVSNICDRAASRDTRVRDGVLWKR